VRVHSSIKNVTFDCADALVAARFWAAALGTDLDEDSTSDKARAAPDAQSQALGSSGVPARCRTANAVVTPSLAHRA
jgi:hypothetical protein